MQNLFFNCCYYIKKELTESFQIMKIKLFALNTIRRCAYLKRYIKFNLKNMLCLLKTEKYISDCMEYIKIFKIEFF